MKRIKERDRTPVATVEVDFGTPPTVKQTDPKCQRYRKCSSSFDALPPQLLLKGICAPGHMLLYLHGGEQKSKAA